MAIHNVVVLLLLLPSVFAVRHSLAFRGARSGNVSASGNASGVQNPVTFRSFYDNHVSGRGIWKWGNSLDAYQRHFGQYAGFPVALAEVGIQSGGSILMWKAVLGAQCHVFGLDINPACQKFADATTTVTIGDQADTKMWDNFYATTAAELDILIDDGGHQPHQMGTTLHLAFAHIKPSGYISIEDIHGTSYVQSFFVPASQSIGSWHAQGQVASVHLYPFLLILHKMPDRGTYVAPAAVTVDSFAALWAAIPQQAGKTIALQNAAWGSLLAEKTLATVFTEFGALHESNMQANPPGCATTAAPVCTSSAVNSYMQSTIVGVHVWATHVFVEVAATPPVIAAVRRGTDWMAYGL